MRFFVNLLASLLIFLAVGDVVDGDPTWKWASDSAPSAEELGRPEVVVLENEGGVVSLRTAKAVKGVEAPWKDSPDATAAAGGDEGRQNFQHQFTGPVGPPIGNYQHANYLANSFVPGAFLGTGAAFQQQQNQIPAKVPAAAAAPPTVVQHVHHHHHYSKDQGQLGTVPSLGGRPSLGGAYNNKNQGLPEQQLGPAPGGGAAGDCVCVAAELCSARDVVFSRGIRYQLDPRTPGEDGNESLSGAGDDQEPAGHLDHEAGGGSAGIERWRDLH